MVKWRVLGAALCVTASATAALAQTPCMGDDELRANLRLVMLTSVTIGIHSCVERFPVARATGQNILARIGSAHKAELDRTEALSAIPFTRAFGPTQGKATHERTVAMAAATGKAQYDSFTLEQCQKHFRGAEVVFDLTGPRPDSTEMTRRLDAAHFAFWSRERAVAPRCNR
jgi:hypothetical protein